MALGQRAACSLSALLAPGGGRMHTAASACGCLGLWRPPTYLRGGCSEGEDGDVGELLLDDALLLVVGAEVCGAGGAAWGELGCPAQPSCPSHPGAARNLLGMCSSLCLVWACPPAHSCVTSPTPSPCPSPGPSPGWSRPARPPTVPPLAAAVSLVDGDAVQPPSLVQLLQLGHQPLALHHLQAPGVCHSSLSLGISRLLCTT